MSTSTLRIFTPIALLGSLTCPLVVPTLHAKAQAAGPQVNQTEADRLLAGGHYLRAELLLKTAVKGAPNDAHILSDLSIVDWAFNRFDAAIADAEKAIAASPNSAEAHSKLTDALGARLAASIADPGAGTFAKLSLAHRFRKEIDRTLELDPNDADALEDLARFYWHAPSFVGGDRQKARQTGDRLFQVSPFRGRRRGPILTSPIRTVISAIRRSRGSGGPRRAPSPRATMHMQRWPPHILGTRPARFN